LKIEQHIAYISVGSNIGDKLLNCQNGIIALTQSGESVLLAQSPFYMTEPVDYEDQDWFVNAAVKIRTSLEPFQLLNQLKSVERKAGRTDGIRFGPRILDMDIIFYDEAAIRLPGLSVPHPRMHQRRFVLKPICDIAPDFVHPILKKDMQFLLANINHNHQRIVQL
jgi:2-amino-4-hydroxy-6-hydroxymethyldihydropteridine diphosphokinase